MAVCVTKLWKLCSLAVYVTLLVDVCQAFLFGSKTTKGSGYTVLTTQPPNVTTAGAGTQEEAFDPVANEAGAIIGVVFGIVLSAAFIAVAAILYIRRKRERDREYNRSSKVQKVSARNAGVYRETTTEDRLMSSGNTRNQGSEYRSLQKHVYDEDSEEEL